MRYNEKGEKNEPFYIVNEVSENNIFNFRPLADDQNWKSIKITHLREIMIRADETDVFVKYEYAEEPKSILIATKKNLGKKYPSLPLRTSKMELDKDKKKDLQKMCSDGVIPEEYHSFYDAIIN